MVSISTKFDSRWEFIEEVFIILFSEPSIRGMLMACSGISSASGIFMVFFLGSFLSWRQVAFICAVIPISSIIAVFFVRKLNLSQIFAFKRIIKNK